MLERAIVKETDPEGDAVVPKSVTLPPLVVMTTCAPPFG
jgi:hypothetical protein